GAVNAGVGRIGAHIPGPDPPRGTLPGMDSLKGKLIIASPKLEDPNFARTVVLVTEHSDEGAMGVVLNRPSHAVVEDAAPTLEGVVEHGELVHVGGPVQPTAVTVLAEFDAPDRAAVMVLDDIGFMAAGSDLDEVAEVTRRARVFAGYAGWGPGQLDGELEREDWFVAPAGIDDIFNPDVDELWARVLARKGAHFALVARMPVDPSVN
ncbi:MAG: YqgE/AlgH family protein, partial [Actinobacteria bacterium]|nr:YqgE/AlgH family protein [Actinomycetota bacterium]